MCIFKGNTYLIFFLREQLKLWPTCVKPSMNDREAVQSKSFESEHPNATHM